jgi:hypothetical protein
MPGRASGDQIDERGKQEEYTQTEDILSQQRRKTKPKRRKYEKETADLNGGRTTRQQHGIRARMH